MLINQFVKNRFRADVGAISYSHNAQAAGSSRECSDENECADKSRSRIYLASFGEQRCCFIAASPMHYNCLSIEAKGMCAYFCVACAASSFAPAVKRQLQELDITKARYYKYCGMLEEAGLMRVEKGRRNSRRLECNTYYLAAGVSPEALFRFGGTAGSEPREASEAAVENRGSKIVENSKPQVSEGYDFDTPQSQEARPHCEKSEIIENLPAKPLVEVVGQIDHMPLSGIIDDCGKT